MPIIFRILSSHHISIPPPVPPFAPLLMLSDFKCNQSNTDVSIFARPILTTWICKYITLKYIIDFRNVDRIICLHVLNYRNISMIQRVVRDTLHWRLKSIQRKSAEERGASVSKSPKSKFTCQLQILLMSARVMKWCFLSSCGARSWSTRSLHT